MIDVGHAFGNGMFVAEPFDNYDHPDSWFVKCRNGHLLFANNDMIEAGTVSCDACARDAAAYARLQERIKLADELDAAGRTNDPDYEALIAAERSQP
jgi:hypothetical protein